MKQVILIAGGLNWIWSDHRQGAGPSRSHSLRQHARNHGPQLSSGRGRGMFREQSPFSFFVIS